MILIVFPAAVSASRAINSILAVIVPITGAHVDDNCLRPRVPQVHYCTTNMDTITPLQSSEAYSWHPQCLLKLRHVTSEVLVRNMSASKGALVDRAC